MNWDVISGQWKQLKGKAQQRWGKLSDSDWNRIEGKREQWTPEHQMAYDRAFGRSPSEDSNSKPGNMEPSR